MYMYMTVYVCLPCCICMYTQEWDVISLNICSISINVYIYKYVMVKQTCVLWSSMKKWPWPHKSLFMVWRPSANMTNSPKFWQWDICKYTVYIYVYVCVCIMHPLWMIPNIIHGNYAHTRKIRHTYTSYIHN